MPSEFINYSTLDSEHDKKNTYVFSEGINKHALPMTIPKTRRLT
jgi:hypothetical protein